MKKTIVALVLLTLVILPGAALAQDVKIGGYLKLDTWWDSSQVGKNLNTPVARNNDPSMQHGRYQATSQSSRFNMTITGPTLWGAKTSGFLEVDFDAQGDLRQSASNAYAPRLRHAFFRLNWPETELLFGQYWGMFCNFYPESVQDGPNQFHGCATQRLPQIRVTQSFMNMFSVSALVGAPYSPSSQDAAASTVYTQYGNVNFYTPVAFNDGGTGGNQLLGSDAEFPQLQFSGKYEADLYGKAPFYGKPRGLVFEVSTAWQRTRYPGGYLYNGRSWGQNEYLNGQGMFSYDQLGTVAGGGGGTYRLARNRNSYAIQGDQQYLNPWVVQWTAFVPILTTKTPNLAGTASMTVQMYVGQGLSFIGNGTDADNTFWVWNGLRPGYAATTASTTQPLAYGLLNNYDRTLQKRYGGYVQAQYYFTNQWYVNYVYGMSKAWGVTQDYDWNNLSWNTMSSTSTTTAPAPTYYYRRAFANKYLTLNDQEKFWQEHALAVYYRPIQAVKFGLQYSYSRTDYFQITGGQTVYSTTGTALRYTGANSNNTNWGDNHRVEFGGWFYF